MEEQSGGDFESAKTTETRVTTFRERLFQTMDRWNSSLTELDDKLSKVDQNRMSGFTKDKSYLLKLRAHIDGTVASFADMPVGLAEITTRKIRDKLQSNPQ